MWSYVSNVLNCEILLQRIVGQEGRDKVILAGRTGSSSAQFSSAQSLTRKPVKEVVVEEEEEELGEGGTGEKLAVYERK